MPYMTEAPATISVDTQPDLMTTEPTTTPLPTPRRRPAALLHFLQTLVTSWTRRRAFESRWIRPGLPRWETPNDHLARQYTYLYIRSMSG
jgi:hypothetical protein